MSKLLDSRQRAATAIQQDDNNENNGNREPLAHVSANNQAPAIAAVDFVLINAVLYAAARRRYRDCNRWVDG